MYLVLNTDETVETINFFVSGCVRIVNQKLFFNGLSPEVIGVPVKLFREGVKS